MRSLLHFRQRHLALLLLALVAALMVSNSQPARLSAQERPASYPWRLTPVASSASPNLQFILSTPKAPGALRLVENGISIPDYKLSPVSKSNARFGVMLVLDSSLSMRGKEAAALDAARQFASRRQGNQVLGVLTFNSRTTTLAPLSNDSQVLSAALAGAPLLANGTHVYDAVATALGELKAAKVDSGTVIVLSDGSDTGSRLSAAAVSKRARLDHTRVFTIGLRSQSYDPSSLRLLAAASGGIYAEAASTRSLATLYSRLGQTLSSEYLLSYRSRIHSGALVALKVSDGNQSAQSRYVVPLGTTLAPSKKSTSSPLSALAAILAPSLLIFFAVFWFLLGRRRVEPSETEEVSTEISAPLLVNNENDKRNDKVRSRSALANSRWWRQLEQDIELAQIQLPDQRRILLYLGGWVALCALFFSFQPVLGLVCMAAPLAARLLLKHKLSTRRKRFGEQFPETLQVMASALRAGHSLSNALRLVTEDAFEPTKSEYKRVLSDESLGIPLDEALAKAATRMENEDLEQVAVVAQLQTSAGGNTAEVFDRVVETVRGRADIQRTVKALTAQGRMARWIVTALPIGLALILFMLNPAYIKPLFVTAPGQVIVILSTVMLTIGSIVIKKIVEIEI